MKNMRDGDDFENEREIEGGKCFSLIDLVSDYILNIDSKWPVMTN